MPQASIIGDAPEVMAAIKHLAAEQRAPSERTIEFVLATAPFLRHQVSSERLRSVSLRRIWRHQVLRQRLDLTSPQVEKMERGPPSSMATLLKRRPGGSQQIALPKGTVPWRLRQSGWFQTLACRRCNSPLMPISCPWSELAPRDDSVAGQRSYPAGVGLDSFACSLSAKSAASLAAAFVGKPARAGWMNAQLARSDSCSCRAAATNSSWRRSSAIARRSTCIARSASANWPKACRCHGFEDGSEPDSALMMASRSPIVFAMSANSAVGSDEGESCGSKVGQELGRTILPARSSRAAFALGRGFRAFAVAGPSR